MSETPEEFRERIGKVATEAEFGAGSWETESNLAHEIASDVAEAVYAQALRDFMDAFDERLTHDSFSISMVDSLDLMQEMEWWLDRLGIADQVFDAPTESEGK